jgi:diphthine-ammonia ligase
MSGQDTFFCSWSGGKDSSLALHRAIQSGGSPACLLTMMIERGDRSRSHGIPKVVLEAQAQCIGIPIRFCSTSWQAYTENFLKELSTLNDLKIHKGVFGDIDLEDHRQWVENTCHAKQVIPCLPLWQEVRTTLLKELFHFGFRAEIIAVKENVLSPQYLGKILNEEMVEEFKVLGIDLCGEAGEYHTIVTDGPIFKQTLHLEHGKQVLKDGYWFSDVALHSSNQKMISFVD